MTFKTDIRALCEEAFFNISSELDREQAEKVCMLVVESNLKCAKDVLNKRITGNMDLYSHIRNDESGFSAGSRACLEAINRTLVGQVDELDKKLVELSWLKNNDKISKLFE